MFLVVNHPNKSCSYIFFLLAANLGESLVIPYSLQLHVCSQDFFASFFPQAAKGLHAFATVSVPAFHHGNNTELADSQVDTMEIYLMDIFSQTRNNRKNI